MHPTQDVACLYACEEPLCEENVVVPVEWPRWNTGGDCCEAGSL